MHDPRQVIPKKSSLSILLLRRWGCAVTGARGRESVHIPRPGCSTVSHSQKERKEKAVHFAHEEKKKVRVVGVREWQRPKQVVRFPGI